MQRVQVDKEQLRKIIQKNRDAHRRIFDKAIEAYRKKAIEELEKRVKLAKANKPFDTFIRMTVPSDHTEDYDRVLGMLKLSVGSTIDLDEENYSWYVEDNWSWKKQWAETTAFYVSQNGR